MQWQEILYGTVPGVVTYSIADAQILSSSFSGACTELGMKISLSKSGVFVQGFS